MYFKRYKICRVFDIPLYVDISFLFVSLLMLSGGIVSALIGSIILAFSLIAHELGHSLTARRYGFETVDITLSVLGGCASIKDIPKNPKEEFYVALNGPLVSFVLVGTGIAGMLIFSGISFLVIVSTYMMAINVMLGAFNLLPGFPMDGGRILRAFLVGKMKMSRIDATYKAMVVGRYFALIVSTIGIISLMFGNIGGFSSLLIAYFIWKAGEAEYKMTVYCP